MTLSEWIGPSVLDITQAPDASVILSMGLIASADVSIGSPPVICLRFEDMGNIFLKYPIGSCTSSMSCSKIWYSH